MSDLHDSSIMAELRIKYWFVVVEDGDLWLFCYLE